jgi:hypothetical protein
MEARRPVWQRVRDRQAVAELDKAIRQTESVRELTRKDVKDYQFGQSQYSIKFDQRPFPFSR